MIPRIAGPSRHSPFTTHYLFIIIHHSLLTIHQFRMHQYKLHLSIAFLSAAIIAFQLALIQVLSIVQWYHFAYMIISVALLGFGAAGTALALFEKKLTSHIEWLLPLLMLITAVTMTIIVGTLQAPFARFDSYLLFTGCSHIR